MNLNFLKKINISSLLNSTGNILNVVKKTIPVYKEIRPFLSKEKKVFEIQELKKESNEPTEYNDSLTFFQ